MTSSLTEAGSNGSSGGGNINPPRVKDKRPSCALNWLFTWHNYPEDWQAILVPEFQNNKNIKGYVAGKEICPKTKTPHLQGYMEFINKARPMGLLPKQVWWKAARGNRNQNFSYCVKDEDYVNWGSVRYTPPYTVNIVLRPWQDEIRETCIKQPDDRTIYWYWEPYGCAGKTTFQKWMFLNLDGVVVLGGKAADIKNGVIEFEEKTGHLPKIVLINIPMCQDSDHVSWQGIEEVKDMFFFSPKYHGGQVCGYNPHVFIFSNEEPPRQKLSMDRWVIRRIHYDRGTLDVMV